MRIISDFNDYYDIGVSYGVDPNIVYERRERELSDKETKNLFGVLEHESLRFKDIINNMFGREVFRLFGRTDNVLMLGFCGKWYFGYAVEVKFEGCKIHWHWSDALEDKLKKKRFPLTDNEIKSIKDLMRSEPIQDMKSFVELESPVIFIRENGCMEVKVTVNPNLKELGFASVVDPWTAFQEVDMFVSGILGQPQPNTDQVSDETLRDAKGFDNMSFKKSKTKKRG